jgi:hypothetical protein
MYYGDVNMIHVHTAENTRNRRLKLETWAPEDPFREDSDDALVGSGYNGGGLEGPGSM